MIIFLNYLFSKEERKLVVRILLCSWIKFLSVKKLLYASKLGRDFLLASKSMVSLSMW